MHPSADAGVETEAEKATRELDEVLAAEVEHEKFCVAERDRLLAIAKQQADADGELGRIGAATIAKLSDTALKWDRAATENRRKRLEAMHDRMLIAHEREMANQGRRAN